MARARRRRRRTPRWLIVGLLLSAVVVSVSVVSSAQTDGPGRRFSQLAYLDSMRPTIERSSAQGAELAQFRSQGLRLGRDVVRRQLERMSQGAREVLAEVEKAERPESLSTPHSMLVATMAVRARAATAVDAAVGKVYESGPLGPVVESLARASEELLAADHTYQVFADSLPAGMGAPPTLPTSRWMPDGRAWDRTDLAVFTATLRSSTAASAVHDVSLLVVATKPPAVGSEGPASVLPISRAFQVEVVVANVGNSAERDVPVVATLAGTGRNSETARAVVDLEPGQRRALTLSGLRPPPPGPGTLAVVVGPVDGETNRADNERVTPVVLRGA